MKKYLLLCLVGTCASYGLVQADEAANKQIANLEKQIQILKKDVQKLNSQNNQVNQVHESFTKDVYLNDAVELYAHGPAVVTSPALGVRRSAENASDLMINLSSINEDLKLLQLRKKMDDYAQQINLPIPKRPIIALSGSAVGKFTAGQRFKDKNTLTQFDMDSAEFSIVGEASPWATGVLVVSYDGKKNSKFSDNYEGEFSLDRGFVTLGQLAKCPVYFSVGKMYAPFGSYSSHMLTDTSAKILGKVHDNMAILGFTYQGLEMQSFFLSGGAKSEGGNILWKHFGANLAYNFVSNQLKVTLASSVLGNFAETKKSPISLYGINNDKTHKSVTGLNARVKINYKQFSLASEYVTALGYLDPRDITINDKACKPRALNLEAAVDFRLFNSPNTFAVGYGRSWDALFYGNVPTYFNNEQHGQVVNFPKHTVFVEYEVSVIKNTILAFEYRHDFNYRKGSVVTRGGNQLTVKDGGQNIFTVKLGVFF